MMYQLIAHSRAEGEDVMLWLTHRNPHTGQHKLANPYQGCKEILKSNLGCFSKAQDYALVATKIKTTICYHITPSPEEILD